MNKELVYVDHEWMRLVWVMGEPRQYDNTVGCLSLLTDMKEPIHDLLTYSDDECINARDLMLLIKRHIRACVSEELRERVINVMLLSIHCPKERSYLTGKWKERTGRCEQLSLTTIPEVSDGNLIENMLL